MRFAVIKNGRVENMVHGDRTRLELVFPIGEYELVTINGMPCGIDWSYVEEQGDYRFIEVETRSIEELKAAKLQQLSQVCQAEITNGFTSDALGSPHHYSSQLEDQINLIGATIGAIAGNSIAYVCTDLESGEKAAKLHTPEQMQQVMAAGKRIKEAALGKFHFLRSQVENVESIEEIKVINW